MAQPYYDIPFVLGLGFEIYDIKRGLIKLSHY